MHYTLPALISSFLFVTNSYAHTFTLNQVCTDSEIEGKAVIIHDEYIAKRSATCHFAAIQGGKKLRPSLSQVKLFIENDIAKNSRELRAPIQTTEDGLTGTTYRVNRDSTYSDGVKLNANQIEFVALSNDSKRLVYRIYADSIVPADKDDTAKYLQHMTVEVIITEEKNNEVKIYFSNDVTIKVPGVLEFIVKPFVASGTKKMFTSELPRLTQRYTDLLWK